MTGYQQVYQGGSRFELREASLPELEDGEVIVSISLATICGSDLHTVQGRRSALVPCVLGHEAVGIVSHSRRPEIKEGQRVTWSLFASCGECPACQEWNLPQKCHRLLKYGHANMNGRGWNGCYASHILLRKGTGIIPLPDSISDALASPLNCAFATVACALESLPQPCDRALVQGGGLIGLFAICWLRHHNVSEVFVSERNESRMEKCLAAGAKRWPAETGLDLVLETAGCADLVLQGMQSMRPGGHYIWVGMVHDQTQLTFRGVDVVKKCLQIRGVHNYHPRHLQIAVDFLAEKSNRLALKDTVSPPWALTDLSNAFESSSRQHWMRIALQP